MTHRPECPRSDPTRTNAPCTCSSPQVSGSSGNSYEGHRFADNWYGISGNEHRTVGPARAWCHTDYEWCYSNPMLYCHCCDQIRLPERWQGAHVSAVLDDIRAQVEAEMKKNSGGYVDALAWVLRLVDTGGGDEDD
jgi:hypothetical protein